MRLQPILMTVFGLALAGGSVFLAEGTLNRENSTAEASTIAPAPDAMVVLITAAEDIPFGEEITRDKLTAQSWPASAAPDYAFDSASDLLGPEGSPPRRALRHIRAGDLISQTEVSRFGESVSITSTLADNNRAMAITVSAATAVGGFVTPGDRVDIVLTQGRGDTLRTGTILQNIRVLGVDQDGDDNSSRSAREARTITVEVSPRESQTLALSQQAGILSLSLRSHSNVDLGEELDQITMDDIWMNAEPAPVIAAPVVEAAPVRTIRVRRGTDQEEVIVE